MIHEILAVGPLRCNCSIIGDEVSREAIVLDPGDETDEILALLKKHGLRVKAILITHAHIDHIGGAAKLRAVTGAPVYMNSLDSELAARLDMQAAWLGIETPENPGIDVQARDGDLISIGSAELRIIETPGHTQGSVSLYSAAENTVWAGDTLFRDGIGRTDLPGGNSRQILTSIKAKLMALPGETAVIPGHGPRTTIERERENNPFLVRR